MIHHSLFTLLNCTIITFLCFTERESTAKGVEVTQQGTAQDLPESFITSLVTVQTCLGCDLPVVFNSLPSTCSSDNADVDSH